MGDILNLSVCVTLDKYICIYKYVHFFCSAFMSPNTKLNSVMTLQLLSKQNYVVTCVT